MLLRSPRRINPPRSSTAQPSTSELPRGNYSSTPLRQLHHIERLFQTAGESLPTSIETADYLVASQCYAMALEQLAALTKSLQDQKE
ncbi:hypothetical protein PF005_g25775 [Phytophthora fragariae]|uniref:Uncharacterized protein n=1 Tax=Phytophthora fragariae TaxID=53985 RepID=A0A6A3QAR6_9STRA|nr:hypothetical protein PF009_g26127 [Phytophthora fragariae]KAE8975192.1 hypothetical protein PF011_g24576 [Phytophthora fragariae]KAE9071673.1 hypothetical protein PF007_g26470 [Phytophthora fragariae]KAE9073166.1 hypothetical protein PF010_g25184 [Phytophthora fragariae]KAE9090958.1 hypothetical protein PF006_g25037 [Phytophthora fragariae]